ncbi:YHS domain-containing protein [Polaromonas sp.]|uniref:YHS domain-containing protein n=1 Tax=Polaromonas sp. TaxID=1869339 RepID=UPI003FA6DE1A
MEKHDHHQHSHGAHGQALADQVAAPGHLKYPVCGMAVAAQSPHRHDHAGKPYYFCSAHCREKFIAGPHTICSLASRSGMCWAWHSCIAGITGKSMGTRR